jgi:hypothetical protein
MDAMRYRISGCIFKIVLQIEIIVNTDNHSLLQGLKCVKQYYSFMKVNFSANYLWLSRVLKCTVSHNCQLRIIAEKPFLIWFDITTPEKHNCTSILSKSNVKLKALALPD